MCGLVNPNSTHTPCGVLQNDFDGQLFDVDQDGQREDSDDEKDGEEEELERQMGKDEKGEDTQVVDEKMWGEDSDDDDKGCVLHICTHVGKDTPSLRMLTHTHMGIIADAHTYTHTWTRTPLHCGRSHRHTYIHTLARHFTADAHTRIHWHPISSANVHTHIHGQGPFAADVHTHTYTRPFTANARKYTHWRPISLQRFTHTWARFFAMYVQASCRV
jgi:hypothetical protein